MVVCIGRKCMYWRFKGGIIMGCYQPLLLKYLHTNTLAHAHIHSHIMHDKFKALTLGYSTLNFDDVICSALFCLLSMFG